MTIIRSNSISGINSITAAPGANLQFFDSTGASLSLDTGNVSAGVITATTLRVTGDLTVEGTTTTLDTVVTEVDKLEVSANNSTVGVAITQSGSGDILRLYDGASRVVTVTDGGNLLVGANDAGGWLTKIQVADNASYQSAFNITNNVNADLQFEIKSNESRFGPSTNTPLVFKNGGGERLRITSSGDVGIGTDTPYSNNSFNSLSVGGSGKYGLIELVKSNGVAGSWIDSYGTNGDGNLRFTTAGTSGAITFWTGGEFTEKVRITSSGNVGIGLTTPSTRLDIYRSGSGVAARFGKETIFGELQVDGQRIGIQGTRSSDSAISGFFVENPSSTGTSNFELVSIKTTGTERLRITSGGYVSIGGVVTNPTNPLVIDRYGDSNFSPSSATELVTKAGLTVNPDSNNSSAKFSVAKHSTGAALLQASNGSGSSTYNVVACPFGGNFLVGTTSASASADQGIKIGPASINMVTTSSSNSTTPLTLYSTGASDYRFFVSAAGNIYAVNTTISSVSDQRLKENIRDLDTGLSEILALQPRRFDWKEGKGKDIQNDQGFIAQEFEQVFPDMVDDWTPSSPEGEDPYKSVRADLIPVLVKAIQEQQAMIETLQTANTSLESRLTALEGGSS